MPRFACSQAAPLASPSRATRSAMTPSGPSAGRFIPLRSPRVVRASPTSSRWRTSPPVTQHAVFDAFVATLKRQGYEVWYDVIDCAEHGLPQSGVARCSSRHGMDRSSCANRDASRAKTVERRPQGATRSSGMGAATRNDRLHAASGLSPLNLERIKASRPGGSWRDWPKHLIAECHRKETGKRYPSVYGRMKWDEPSPTLTTQFYGFGSGRFGHPTQARAISLREERALQGLPAELLLRARQVSPSSSRVLGRLIGNAVPVELGRVIGESIIAHVKEHFGQSSPSTNQRRRRNGREHTASTVVA